MCRQVNLLCLWRDKATYLSRVELCVCVCDIECNKWVKFGMNMNDKTPVWWQCWHAGTLRGCRDSTSCSIRQLHVYGFGQACRTVIAVHGCPVLSATSYQSWSSLLLIRMSVCVCARAQCNDLESPVRRWHWLVYRRLPRAMAFLKLH